MARPGLPMLHGILPLQRSRVPIDMLAGVTLAALSIPEVLGYAKIAGMPVVTGLYTLLLPMAVFAVLGSSRHLVVGADSATAAILAAGLVGIAAAGSPRYVQLAGLAALMAGALLLLARVTRLGFLADFLSRTVLVGFLTGVGIEVALGQLPDMLGVPKRGRETVSMVVHTVQELGQAQLSAMLVAVGVIVIVIGVRLLNPRIPGGLIAVVAAITVSWAADLAAKGIHVVGSVPRGLPDLTVPTVHWHDVSLLFGVAASMFAVILAQSAATSRAYAAKYEEEFTEDVDLVGLGGANVAAAFTGTFVVNGSPTKTQIVDGAGGRSQLSQLTAGGIVLLVLVLVTKPLEYLPTAALAAVVFLIGLQLIDVHGLRRLFAVRRAEFAVAVLTTLAVVLLGVEQGVILAVLASMVDHLRHSYSPHNSVLVKSARGTLAIRAGVQGSPHGARPGHLPLRHQRLLRERGAPGHRRRRADRRRAADVVLSGRRGDRRRRLLRRLRVAADLREGEEAWEPTRAVEHHRPRPPPARPLRHHRRRRIRRVFRHRR